MNFNIEMYCESVSLYLFGFFLVASIASGVGVFTNQLASKEKKSVIFGELYDSVIVFVTGKYLNDKGKKWRPFYCISMFVTMFIIVSRSSYCG